MVQFRWLKRGTRGLSESGFYAIVGGVPKQGPYKTLGEAQANWDGNPPPPPSPSPEDPSPEEPLKPK